MKKITYASLALVTILAPLTNTLAAVALDRTRIIYNEGEKAVSLNVSNQNKELPYLAQGWIENEQGKKIATPFTVLPPIQRIEPGESTQIRVQALPAVNGLAKDRESLFYFNLREIPPRSDQPNTLQIALQTRIKVFYRPKSLVVERPHLSTAWQNKLVLERNGERYTAYNPTGYFITLVDASRRKGEKGISDFEPVMIAPKSRSVLNVTATKLGNAPALTYIDDYGGRPVLQFQCKENNCTPVKDAKYNSEKIK